MNRLLILIVLCLLTVNAFGQSETAQSQQTAIAVAASSKIDTGDTAWVLISAALVMLMTPGLAFFYGGLVRRKNMLSVLMQCFIALCVISIQWIVVGYSLSFGPDKSSIIGGNEWFFLNSVGMNPNPDYAATIPHELFMIFQMMFAVITPALIIGAFAERMKFSSFVMFTLLWATLVYNPVTHWFWGTGGFMKNMGALDFAGGAVVHINAGLTALAAALILGKRKGYPSDISPPHNLPFAILGAGLLWFGWFGFNAGSALKASSLASNTFVVTHIAGVVAGITWSILDWLKFRKPTTLGMITGSVAGLAAVTPASGFITPVGAIWIGLGAGILPWLAITCIKGMFGYDDSLDVFGVHGIGGIWGMLAAGVWATKTINPDGADGLLYGNPAQLWIQFKAVIITMVYSFVMGAVLLKLVDIVMNLRVSEDEERVGLDLTQHREAAYTLVD
jgi:Amt family ammonium transporter